MDEKEPLNQDLAEYVLIASAAEKIKASGKVKPAIELGQLIFVAVGLIAALLLPILLLILIPLYGWSLQEAFEEFSGAFGILYIIAYLVIRWLIRKLIKTVKRDPHYFDDKKCILEFLPGVGIAMIVGSLVFGSVLLVVADRGGGPFAFFFITFTGMFTPFSHFISEK